MKKIISLALAVMCLFLFGIANTISAEDYSNLSPEELAKKIAELEALLATQNATQEQIKETIEITVTINEQTRTGNYTGETVDGKPHGKGSFVSNDSLPLLTYEGSWDNGQVSGNGYIETESFLVHFDEGKYDRIGTYKGSVLNGLPSGNGYFLTQNKNGITWSYTGAWSNGTFNGYGVQAWDDEDNTIHEGNFVNSEYRPTFGQLHASVLSKHGNYVINSSHVDFIDNNEKFFSTGKGITSQYVDENFEISKFKKHQSSYSSKLIKAEYLKIVQVFSYELYGRAFEFAIMEDREGTLYWGYFDGTTSLYDSSLLKSIYLLPIDWATYENTAGQKLWAVFCAYTKSYEEFKSVEVKATSSSVYLRNRSGAAITLIKAGKSFYITGYDSAIGMFTATYDGWEGYLKGSGLNISKEELLDYFQ